MTKLLLLILALTLMVGAEQFHPIDEMEPHECYAEYGTNCTEAEEYEAEEEGDDD